MFGFESFGGQKPKEEQGEKQEVPVTDNPDLDLDFTKDNTETLVDFNIGEIDDATLAVKAAEIIKKYADTSYDTVPEAERAILVENTRRMNASGFGGNTVN